MSDNPTLAASGTKPTLRTVELAGGVGGGKLAHGLQAVLGPDLSVVVNTGDDLERHGLAIWPDHDSVMYALAGLDDRTRGWGLAEETWTVSERLAALGEETWFRLGDRDLATHIARTARLGRGERPTDVALDLQRRLGVRARILPMSDDRVRTEVRTDAGWLEFQEYFVRLHQEPVVREVRFVGAELARPSPEVERALAGADVVVVGPSNPIVSIGPILAVPGMLDEIHAARHRGARAVGVSGIVAGKALRGPADRMLASLGSEASALGVARRYAAAGILDTFVIDTADADLAAEIEALGLNVRITDTIMKDSASRLRLAREILAAVKGP